MAKMAKISSWCFRNFSSAAKSQLAILRKRTGFPLSKCREALSSNQEDLEAAEKWLHFHAQSEGWSKIEKLRDRATKQGLIGMLIRGNKAAMVEVNCETDFVARNEIFQTLVSDATNSLFDHTLPPSKTAAFFTQDELSQMSTKNSKSLADAVATSVGHLLENIVLQRGCLFTPVTPPAQGLVCGHVYNSSSTDSEVAMGKYAALLHLLPVDDTFDDLQAAQTLGRHIGQHIIGLNPSVANRGDKGVEDATKILSEQAFVLDDEVIVGDMLAKNKAKVIRFVRYALGESNNVD